jgi:hypothetical protein
VLSMSGTLCARGTTGAHGLDVVSETTDPLTGARDGAVGHWGILA